MRKRLLSFFLITILCISNVVSVYAIEATIENEEVIRETEETEQDSSVWAETFEEETTIPVEVVETGDDNESEVSVETTEEEMTTGSEDYSSGHVVLPANMFEEIGLESLDRNYIVDKTAPYSGEYVIMTNVSKFYPGTAEKVGGSQDVISGEVYEDPIIADGIVAADAVPDNYNEGIEDDETDSEVELEAVTGLGSRREFKLRNGTSGQTTCECVSVTEHCVVWVPINDPIFVESPARMRSYMGQVSAEFEAKYDKLTASFGNLEYADYYGDRDGKVALICYDFDGDASVKSTGFTSGFFSGTDMNVLFSNATGNRIDCLHLDSWQGMKRSSDGLTLNNVEYIYETMMHELQHMIMWSNLRKMEGSKGEATFEMKVPAWIEEGFSEAAVHLCYGKSTGRIDRYNEGAVRGGQLSLYDWKGDLNSYALDYLFFQYVRAQYAMKTETDGWSIYSKAMSHVTETSDSLSDEKGTAVLDAIAAELGVSGEELVENFWIALFMLNGSGPYGFGGEAWAEAILPQVTAGKAATLMPGASQVIAINGDYVPTGYGPDIVFAGLSKENSVSSREDITVSGATTLSTIGAKTTLVATSTRTSPADVIWSIPKEDDREIVKVDSNGTVTALAKYGTVTVRATSTLYPDVYGEITLEVLHDTTKDIRFSKRTLNSAYCEKTFFCQATRPAGISLYYTLDNREANQNDARLTADGIKIEGPSSTTVNILAKADGYYDTTLTETISFVKLSPPEIKTTVNENGSCNIEFLDRNENSVVFYTLDGSSPLEKGIHYASKAFTVPIENVVKVRALCRRLGYMDSNVEEYSFDSYPRATFSDIEIMPVYGGYRFEVESKDKTVELRYTLDGSQPTRSSRLFPTKGLTLDVGQDIHLRVTGWKSGCIPVTKNCDLHLDKLDKPMITTRYVGYLNAYEVTIEDSSENDGLLILYKVDSESEQAYTGPFYVDAEANHAINANSLGIGAARSDAQKATVERVIPPYRRLTATPRLVSSTVTLNKQQYGEVNAPLTLMSMENEEILNCRLDGKNAEAFELEHIAEDDWQIKLKDMSLKQGAYKFTLYMRGTEYSEEPEQKATLTVKVVDKKPVVSLKKVTAYKFYSDSVLPLSISSKDGDVQIIALKNKVEGFTDNFELRDTDSDGKMDSITMVKSFDELTKDIKNKPVIAGYLTVKVDGYVEQDIPINISMNATLPKIAQAIANLKYDYNGFEADGYKASIPLTIVNIQNKKVPFAIAAEDKIQIDTKAKTYEKIAEYLSPDKPVSIDSNGSLVINLARPEDKDVVGSFTVPLLISGRSDIGEFANVPISVKFIVDKQNMQPKATMKPANLSLNKQTNDHAYSGLTINYPNVRIKDVICNPLPAAGKANLDEKVGLRYNESKNCIEAYFESYTGPDSLDCNLYKFECIPVLESIDSKTEITCSQTLKVTVTVTNKAFSVNATPKGSVDVMNRNQTFIRYTMKRNGFGADFKYSANNSEVVKIVAPDSVGKNEIDGKEMFELTGEKDSFAKASTVDIRLKDSVPVVRGQKYVFRMAFLMENGEYAYSPNLKIIPVQPNVVLKQKFVPTLYKNVNMRKRVAVIPIETGNYEIERVTLNGLKNVGIPKGMTVTLEGESIKVTLNDSSTKPAKYMIHLNVIYKGEMAEKDNNPKVYTASYGIFVK